jgi:hypothetical protein
MAATLTLAAAVAAIAKILGTAPWGALFHITEGGHFTKRSAYIAAIITGGPVATVRANYARYATLPLRWEHATALATGDVSYFRDRKGGTWASWAHPLIADDNTLRATVTDDMLAAAALRNIVPTPSDVSHMCATITVMAQRRNVSPLPVFTDAGKTLTVEPYDAAKHGDAYASEAHGGATFTLTPKPATTK